MSIADDCTRYANCMEDIKWRQKLTMRILDGHKSTGSAVADIEFCYLQLRKILELIALSSLCANRAKYEEIKTSFHKEWNASDIVKRIRKFNPEFYPQPSRQVLDAETGKPVRLVAIKTGYLEESEFLQAHGKCGQFLHADNPYTGTKFDAQFHRDHIAQIVLKIKTLLNHHTIQLVDAKLQLWVLMASKSDGRVHVFEMEQVESEK